MEEWQQRSGVVWLIWITAVSGALAAAPWFLFWNMADADFVLRRVTPILSSLFVIGIYVQSLCDLMRSRLTFSPATITHLDWRGRERVIPRDATTTLAEGRLRFVSCFFVQPPRGRVLILPKRTWQLADPARVELLRRGLTIVREQSIKPWH